MCSCSFQQLGSISWAIACKTMEVILLSVPSGIPCLVLISAFKENCWASGSVPKGSRDHQCDVHGLQEPEKELELFSQRRKT